MMTINDFTNEEKVLYSGIIFKFHRDVVSEPLATLPYALRKKGAMAFSAKCTELVVDAGISPEVAEGTPFSNYVWKNMGQEKRSYVLKKLEELYEVSKGDVTINYIVSILFKYTNNRLVALS